MRFAHKEESMKIDRLIFAFFLGALVWACSDSKVAGTATDTENTVAGLVRPSELLRVHSSRQNGVSVMLLSFVIRLYTYRKLGNGMQ